ncbi:hypothetical protein EYW98_23045 [Escherichia coli]|nr:hypothetical protein [Escherichia coli]EGO8379660.1 hypothetical protein [Escherichia coli]
MIIKIPAPREITFIEIPGLLFLITEEKVAIMCSFPIRTRQRHPTSGIFLFTFIRCSIEQRFRPYEP